MWATKTLRNVLIKPKCFLKKHFEMDKSEISVLITKFIKEKM